MPETAFDDRHVLDLAFFLGWHAELVERLDGVIWQGREVRDTELHAGVGRFYVSAAVFAGNAAGLAQEIHRLAVSRARA